MSTAQTAVVSAVVSAVVTVIVGTLVQWGARIVAAVRGRVIPDHRPIDDGGGYSATRIESSGDQVRVLVCCAPNRTLRRREINPDLAVRLLRGAFGRWVGEEPVYSSPRGGVRFEGPGSVDRAYAWAHAGGRIDLCRTIPTTGADTGEVAIAVQNILEVLAEVDAAVRSPQYTEVFGRRLLGLPRRFDWTTAVSTTITTEQHGAVHWKRLDFPRVAPPRRGTQQQSFLPPEGYAGKALRDWSLRRPRARLYAEFLRDFLYVNGYHDVDEAIRRTIATGAPPDGRSGRGQARGSASPSRQGTSTQA